MSAVSDKLKQALNEVLYDSEDVVEAFVAKVDELVEENLGVAFARYCLFRIKAFPRPLRSFVLTSLPSTSLSADEVVDLVRPGLDHRMWRESMRVLHELQVPREEWFQDASRTPSPLREQIAATREHRMSAFTKMVEAS